MNALLVDAGNSRIKWGAWSGGSLQASGSLSTDAFRNGEAALPDTGFSTTVISNVAGERVAERLRQKAPGELVFVASASEQAGVVNAYADPRQLGVDRWVALLGARAEFQSACLVVDAGTALTIDALASDGRHLGGLILPGAPLMMASLAARTSDLPDLADTPGSAPDSGLFAVRTEDAIRHGAWTATVGAVEHAFRQLKDSNEEARLVLTGGDAPRMLDAVSVPVEHRPDLVLKGLATVLESLA